MVHVPVTSKSGDSTSSDSSSSSDSDSSTADSDVEVMPQLDPDDKPLTSLISQPKSKPKAKPKAKGRPQKMAAKLMPSSQQAAALAWIMERQEVSPDKALQDLEEKLEQTEKQILEIDALERDDAANSQKQETKTPFKLTCELNAAIDVLKSIGHARLGSIDSIAPVLLNMLEVMYEKVSSGDGARQTLQQTCFGMVDLSLIHI